MEAIQLEYAFVTDNGLENLKHWIPLGSYGALVRADMQATRIRASKVSITWEYLRDDIDTLRSNLFVALSATSSPLKDAMLSDEAKPLAEQVARDLFSESFLNMKEAINKHRRLGEEFVVAYRELAEPSR